MGKESVVEGEGKGFKRGGCRPINSGGGGRRERRRLLTSGGGGTAGGGAVEEEKMIKKHDSWGYGVTKLPTCIIYLKTTDIGADR